MRSGQEKSVDELVKAVLRGLGISKQYMEYEAKRIWPEVVGALIASKTTKVDVFGGVLYVSFSSAVVRNEMVMVKESLLGVINDRLGEDVIKNIVIR